MADKKAPKAENRRHRRVDVSLTASVVLARGETYDARTVDVSEGGILLDSYQGPALRKGRLVGIDVQGIVSNEDDDGGNQLLMRVVRYDGETIALRFDEEASRRKR